jgi:hypothetical protein
MFFALDASFQEGVKIEKKIGLWMLFPSGFRVFCERGERG